MGTSTFTSTPTYQDDFKLTIDEQGNISASQSFVCSLTSSKANANTAYGGAPACPAYATDWGTLTCNNVSITYLKPDGARVTCTYKGAVTSAEFDPETSDYYRTKFSVVMNDEPLETHKRYDSITSDDRKWITLLIKGSATFKKGSSEIVLWKKSKDEIQEYTFTGAALELAKKITEGHTQYKKPYINYGIEYSTSVPPTIAVGLGKISSPVGAPSLGAGNYLFIGKTADGEIGQYQVTEEYLGSVEGWDSDIYEA